MSKRFIYWFRNDLRLHDNEAFWNAIRDADEVLPVYVFDPRRFRMKALGFRKTGIKRAYQIIQAVSNLRQEFQRRGGDLLIRIGEPEKIVSDLANNYNVAEIRASKEITLQETNIEASLSKKLKGINVDISLTWMSTLTHPHDLPFYISRLPYSYADFARAVSKIPVRKPAEEGQLSLFWGEEQVEEFPDFSSLGFSTEEIEKVSGEEKTESQINDLIQSEQAQPAEIENWISGGVLSPRAAYHYTRDNSIGQEMNERLIWRDYLQFIGLKWGTRLFKPSGLMHRIDRKWQEDKEKFEQWAYAKTDDPEVNRIMQQLNETGLIGQEEFKIVASYLVEKQGVNWTWGAEWFESQLKYYDTVIVWGTWNYLSGVGLEETVPC